MELVINVFIYTLHIILPYTYAVVLPVNVIELNKDEKHAMKQFTYIIGFMSIYTINHICLIIYRYRYYRA